MSIHIYRQSESINSNSKSSLRGISKEKKDNHNNKE